MLDTEPHQFGDDKPKCMEYDPFGALFHGFESLFASLNPDPLKRDKQDPDPRQGDADPQHCL
jgi:hypothetical protein